MNFPDLVYNNKVINYIIDESIDSVRTLYRKYKCKKRKLDEYDELKYIICHSSPHLDEYFAELIFRAFLPEQKDKSIKSFELSIYSRYNDINCKCFWPYAAVLGFGNDIENDLRSNGIAPLIIFDEHGQDGSRLKASCCEIFVNKYLNLGALPSSFKNLQDEVNNIDSRGGACSQHFSKIIKLLNNHYFVFNKDKIGKLDDYWKRAIIWGAISAVIEFNENKTYFSETKYYSIIREYLDLIEKKYNSLDCDQKKIKSAKYIINKWLHNHEVKKNSHLVLNNIIYACYIKWGAELSKVIVLPMIEALFEDQYQHFFFDSALKKEIIQSNTEFYCEYGTIKIRNTLFLNNPFCLIEVKKQPILINHGIFLKKIKEIFSGKGLLILNDAIYGNKVVFVPDNFNILLWQTIVEKILEKENTLWHVERSDNTIARFINNGNESHRYVPKSDLELDIQSDDKFSLESLLLEIEKNWHYE